MAARMTTTARRRLVGGLLVIMVVVGGGACSSGGDTPDDTAKRDAAAKDDPAEVRRVVRQALKAYYDEDCSEFRKLATDRVSGNDECIGYAEFLDGLPYKFDVTLRKVSIEDDSAVVTGQTTVTFDGSYDTYAMEFQALKVDGEWKYDGREQLRQIAKNRKVRTES